MPDADLSTGDPEDDAILRFLAQHGNLDQPRLWEHYLYCDGEEAVRATARELTAAGWTADLAADPDGGPVWGIRAEQDSVVVSAGLVRQARRFFVDLAARLPGGVYDGWQASV